MKKILLSSLIAVMAVSAANAKIASTDYADSVADAAEAAAISAAAEDATTKADTALGTAKGYTDTKITELTTTGAIKTNTDAISANTTAIAGIKEDMKSVATNETVTDIQSRITKLEATDTTDGSVRQLIKAANDTQNTQIEAAYAKKATTLEGYGIADAYTETEVNNLLSAKADSANVYTKTDIDAKLGAEGTTGQAIAAAAAAQAAQATADGAVSVNTEQATAITNLQTADSTINAKFGELNGKTVAQAIADAQSTATYNDTAVRGLITANADAIDVINNGAVMKSGIDSTKVTQIETNRTAIATLNGSGDGSVSKAVTDGIAGITATVTGNTGVIKTLSQTAGKVSAARELVTTTDLDATVNSAITDANNAASFMRSVQDASTNQDQADKAYVLTASRGQDNTWTYTWEEIDRTALGGI